ncbi:MAG: DUF2971 domain-containing protein [Bacteroidales bacterium]|nr:DUF2971 domain-containing protein [Bacteroidales bacterium]
MLILLLVRSNAEEKQIEMKIQQIDFNEIELPDLIFKYRNWSSEYHKTIITERKVFMASPSSFEDKLDCKIPIRYDLLSQREIFDKYFHYSKIDNPKRNRAEHRKHARKWTKKYPLSNPDNIALFQKKYFEDFFERFGILSLTAESENDDMWIKYSDDFKGFCVGFNTKIMFESFGGGGGNVNYYDELPLIYPEPKFTIGKIYYYQVFSKERKWEFEKEYRTYKFSQIPFTDETRNIVLPPEAYKCIILGKNMPTEFKEELRNSIPDELSHIEIIEN